MDSNTALSLIDHGQVFEGTFAGNSTLIIRGEFRGTINGDTVIIAKGGVARADMTVARLTVGGIFEGDVQASEKLLILPSGKCSGRVVCNGLIVESGGILNAEILDLSATQEFPAISMDGSAAAPLTNAAEYESETEFPS